MSKGLYVGADGIARKAKALYAGVDGIARKAIKGYIGDINGIARQFWPNVIPLVLNYSGAHTVRTVTHNGVTYDEWALTGSGIMTVQGAGNVALWLCGGGASGSGGDMSGDGGGGAFAMSGNVQLNAGDYAVTIGAGGAARSITQYGQAGGQTTAFGLVAYGAAEGQYAASQSGTGGGNGGYERYTGTVPVSLGDGLSKVPFDDTANHSALCAGGGGGAYYYNHPNYRQRYVGGIGGSNGADGGLVTAVNATPAQSQGGATGGGQGGSGSTSTINGTDATAPGSGGGGGGWYMSNYAVTTYGTGGAGAGGVVYLRVTAAA
ncbi:MAG: hypothetical protein LBM74_08860 [Oscillospiraceae bacterium]|jgi:hypothetical protein|nr:hypothetical protein [Oscillospiraceae bacterium]